MDKPKPAGISDVSIVILENTVTLQVPEAASPHALNTVANGGSSALLAAISKVPRPTWVRSGSDGTARKSAVPHAARHQG